MAEKGLSKNEIISLLTKSEHSKGKAESLEKTYFPIAKKAAESDPEFLAHLIAWNERNGSIRDSKIALPIASLKAWGDGAEFAENSFAHLALLGPIELSRASYLAKQTHPIGNGRKIRYLIEEYLRTRERKPAWWDATALTHRKAMKDLYSLQHIKPSSRADRILFKESYKRGEVFQTLKELKSMKPGDAAAAIINKKIPFQTAMGYLGKSFKDENIVLALIENMTPNQLVNSTKFLERLGVKTNPALKAAYEAGLGKAVDSKKNVNTFKTTVAAEALGEGKLKEKLKATQEKQIERLGRVKGRWLVLGDKSGSMTQAIEASRQIAATLARMAEDNVWLIFFDAFPSKVINAKGMSYDELLKETKSVVAGGGTSIGCGLQYLMERGIEVDGIVIASDGGEGQAPRFADVLGRYEKKFDKDLPVYFYDLPGETDYPLIASMKQIDHDMQVFDMRNGRIDYYALPNLIQTMSIKRYGLIDKIMETPLLRVRDVIQNADWG